MRYVKREIETKFEKYLSLPQIIAIVGPRRSGKTTLIQNLKSNLKNSAYISFEDQKKLDLFNTDIENFIKIELQNYNYLFIDEFQYAKDGGKQLKYIHDFFPEKKIIISGSSAVELTIQAVKYLVGRIIVLNLFPFNFSEFLLAKDDSYYSIYLEQKELVEKKKLISGSHTIYNRFNEYLFEYLLYGGYPEVVLVDDFEIKKELLNNIYSIYFLKEVRDLLGLIEDFKLKTLIKALSLQIGNIVLYNELSTISSVTASTLKHYLNFFEKTFIAYTVKPYFTNKRVELVKNPKPYFFDLGFRNTVIDNFSPLDNRTDYGAIRENFAGNSLSVNNTVNFWRTKAGAEVDFVIEKGGTVTPIEIKTRVDQNRISQSLQSFIKKYKPSEAYIYTLDHSNKTKFENTTVYFIPLFLI